MMGMAHSIDLFCIRQYFSSAYSKSDSHLSGEITGEGDKESAPVAPASSSQPPPPPPQPEPKVSYHV